MATPPQGLTLEHHRDQATRVEPLVRRVGVALLVVLCALGLANFFGQRPGTSKASAAAASLSVYAPSHLRSGLYFEARFHVTAHRDLKKATLVLDPGWAEGITINTIEPGPIGEASADGKLVLTLGHIPAGKSYILFAQLQVNPTNVGRRSQNVELDDGTTPLLRIKRTVTIFP
ncbi:MAG TPA: hypothetical protein VF101_07040 [Gaiellaceae bacterium]